ncbi:hypothetical protein EDD15DRAFT_1315442 [Pisolithus albus]|nr:hypothetical protein EDD15DRAFT_1315442 [Pisolithus albus]
MEFANNLSHCTSHSHRNQPHTCVTRRREGKKTQTSIRRIERFRLLEKSNVVDARTWQCLCSCLEMFILVPGNVCEPRLDSTGLHYGPTCHGCHGVCARREAAPNTTDLPPAFHQHSVLRIDHNLNGNVCMPGSVLTSCHLHPQGITTLSSTMVKTTSACIVGFWVQWQSSQEICERMGLKVAMAVSVRNIGGHTHGHTC